MIKVGSPLQMEADPQGGWQLIFWVEAFDFQTPFRAMPIEIANALGLDTQKDLYLPTDKEDEDFIEGVLQFGAARLKVYFEYTLGYLALMSDDETLLRDAAERIRPLISVEFGG